jgi:copper chaperone CopZ
MRGVFLVETRTRARHLEDVRQELARATLFLGGMYCSKCTEEIRNRLAKVGGVVEVLVTNYVETPYGIAQVFYDSKQVSPDQVLAKLGSPYWATLIEDKDPKRERLLQRYTEIYVC